MGNELSLGNEYNPTSHASAHAHMLVTSRVKIPFPRCSGATTASVN
jgi:hypothetical protein